MGRLGLLPLSALLLWGSAGAAFSGPAYDANDIVGMFAPKAEEGETRGVCIGTERECKQPPSKANLSQSFDLQVTFDLNSNNLTDTAKTNLNEFAKALDNAKLRPFTFLIEGHTDARGGSKYNLNLSERRADEVVKYLTDRGVDARKLKPKGYGKLRPKTPDPFEAANRRVETRISQ